MTILLPLEIKVREFHSKIFLASKLLDETNFDVVIGEKNKVYNLFKHNQGVYLLSKGGPRKRFGFDKKKYRNNFLGILDEEGPISNFDVNEKIIRLNVFLGYISPLDVSGMLAVFFRMLRGWVGPPKNPTKIISIFNLDFYVKNQGFSFIF